MTQTVDANAYMGAWPYWPIAEQTPAQVAALGAEAGIGNLLLCSTRAVFLDAAEGNDELFSACAGLSQVSVAAVFNPRGGSGAVDRIARDAQRGAAAIRMFPQHHRYRLSAELYVREGVKQAARLGLPVILSSRLVMNWGLPVYDPLEAGPIIAATPQVTYILSGINYGAELATARSLMRQFPNVFIETSCLQGFRSLPELVREFGPERVLFGAGLPVQYPACAVAKLDDPDLSRSEVELVRGGSLERLVSSWRAVT